MLNRLVSNVGGGPAGGGRRRRRSYLGQDAANPATTAAEVYTSYTSYYGSAPSNGTYWIKPTGVANAFQAYCKFNFLDSNHWVLMLKVHNQGDLPSGSSYWTNSTLYNETDFNLTSGTWSKYRTWIDYPFTRLAMVMTQGGSEKVPPIMIFNTSRTFSDAITLSGGSNAASGQNNTVKCDSTDPSIATNATYHNVSMKSGSNFTDVGGAEDIIQGYGIAMWANNASNSTTAEGLSSVGRAGAWIGCPLDEGGHTFNANHNTGADSGFGFGASTGNTAKTTSAGYSEWTNSTSTNTLPAYVYIR